MTKDRVEESTPVRSFALHSDIFHDAFDIVAEFIRGS